MEEKLKKIIKHYGPIEQIKQLDEEVKEFIETITDYERDSKSQYSTVGIIQKDKAHMEEEFADVMVMMEQYALYYGLDKDKIKEIMQYKVNRQLRRIENEQNNKNNM